jgi:hypothetical protein
LITVGRVANIPAETQLAIACLAEDRLAVVNLTSILSTHTGADRVQSLPAPVTYAARQPA